MRTSLPIGLVLVCVAFTDGISFPQDASRELSRKLIVSSRRTEAAFPPVNARAIRLIILQTLAGHEPGIDEIEVFSSERPHQNVALASHGSKASSSGCTEGFAIHKDEHLNDGKYGNHFSWVSKSLSNNWVQIDFPRSESVQKVVWARDRLGIAIDRTVLFYRIEALIEEHWRVIASNEDRELWTGGTVVIEEKFSQDAFLRKSVSPPFEKRDYLIERWDTGDGLPQSSVFAIAQTTDGYLWLATYNGLVRFDGVRFKVFDPSNSLGLPSRRFFKLFADIQGRLWIKTDDGRLVLMENGKFRQIKWPGGEVSISEEPMVEQTPDGKIWVASDKGLWLWEEQDWKSYSMSPVRYPVSTPILSGPSAWQVLGQAVGVFEDNEWRRFETRQGERSLRVCRGFPAADGALFFLDEGTDAFEITPQGHIQVLRQFAELPCEFPTRMIRDLEGNFWFGSYTTGLLRWREDGTWIVYNKTNGLSQNAVTALYADREGSIWAGTAGGGLNRLKKKSVEMLGSAHGLPEEVVHSVVEDQDRNLLIGLIGSGIWRFPGGGDSFRLLSQDWAKYAWSLLRDSQGRIWAGTYGSGLLRFDQTTERIYWLSGLSMRRPIVTTTFEDREGTLWAGGPDGVARLNGEDLAFFTTKNGLSHNDVRAIAQNAEGIMWFATLGGGLNKLQGGRFEHFRKSDGLAHDSAWCLYFDQKGVLWIGTFGGGVSRFEAGRFVNYDIENGLHDRVICGIVEDARGNMWMSSYGGVFRVSRAEMDDYAAGKITRIQCYAYDRSDGLLSKECTGGSQPSLCLMSDGRICVPTVKGVAVIDPPHLGVNTNIPPVEMEEVRLDGHEQEKTAELQIPPGTDRVEIHYTALSFLSPAKVRFRYILEGYDKDWIDGGGQRMAQYTRIPPGRYTFRVVAANNDGFWNTKGAAMQVVALPFFWQTNSFRGGVAGCLLAGVFWLHRSRVQRLEKEALIQAEFSRKLLESQETERKRIAAELHDGIGQSLLIATNRAASATDDQAMARLAEIRDFLRHTLEEVREISHDLRPAHLEKVGLTKAVEGLVRNAASATDIQFTIQIEGMDGLLPESFSIHVYRLLQEAVSNLLKHSQANRAELQIKRGAEEILIQLADHGVGFDRSKLAPEDSFGLAGLEERVKLMNGSWQCDSRPGGGTRIEIRIPYSKNQ